MSIRLSKCARCKDMKDSGEFLYRGRICKACRDAEARAAIVAAEKHMSHDEWQRRIVTLAELYGWSHLHVRKSIATGRRGWQTTTNINGWPDLFLWHPRRGGFLAIEVKVPPDKARPEQEAVLAGLEAAGAATIVAYPDDLPLLQAMLDTRRRQPNLTALS